MFSWKMPNKTKSNRKDELSSLYLQDMKRYAFLIVAVFLMSLKKPRGTAMKVPIQSGNASMREPIEVGTVRSNARVRTAKDLV